MFAAIIKSYYAEKNNIDPKDIFVVSIILLIQIAALRLQRYKKYCIYASFWRIICVFSHFSSSTDGVSVGNRHALRTQINALYNDIGD